MKRADVVSALAWLAVALFVTRAGWELGLGTLHDPGAGFLLFWAGVVMTGLALVVGIGALRRPAAADVPVEIGGGWPKLVAVLAALVLYAWLLERLGFLLTTAPVLIFLFRAVEPQRWSVAVAGGIVSTLAAWAIFQLWLGAQLPRGILGIG